MATKLKKSEERALHKSIRESMKFDWLKMLWCEDYVTKGGIVIREPRIGEIMAIGEEDFYRNLNIWVTNTTSYRLSLWGLGVDWCKLTDYELFCNLYQAIDVDIMKLIVPNIDLMGFEKKIRVLDEENEVYDMVLYSEEQDMIIDYMEYLEASQYLRTLFNIFPKDEFAKGRSTKESMIFEDEEEARKRKDEPYKSSLFPLVSACINHPGFKHGLNDLKDVGIFEFMDSVNRLQIYENTRAMINGSMSGFADMSKVPKENFNFMRDIYVKDTKTKPDSETFKNVIENYGKGV